MEIPVIARLSDFDASIASLSVANPPLICRLLSIFELGRFSSPQRFWKWGALLLALIYAFSSVVRRIKILFVQRHRRTSKNSSSSEPLLACSDDDDDVVFSDDEEDDENDDVRSSYSSEDERDERREVDLASSSYENLGGFYEDFRVAGSVNSCDRRGKKRKFRIRRRRSLAGDNFSSLAELVSGKGVVKLWDGLRFGLDLGNSPSSSFRSADSISFFDPDKDVMIGSILGQIPSVSVSPSSPRVVFTATAGGDGRVGLSSWDMRMRRRRPPVEAEWRRPPVEAEWRMERRSGPVVEVKAGGVDKVYVRDDVSGNMTVGDMRKARSPLVNVTEYDGDRWFDSNAVSETEE